MPGVELLRAAGQRFGPGPKREVAQAALFELGELAADVFGRPGDDARHAELAAQRDADSGAGQPLVGDQRAKRFGQLLDAALGVQRGGFLAPANRARDDFVAAPSVPLLRTTSARCSIERQTSKIAQRPSDCRRRSPLKRRSES